ncbi:MAG: hypothetical protein IJU50_02600 [Lachnospiraceae bacterium]|nr:hypothetical protein [Lachnospiraceae bacterium]
MGIILSSYPQGYASLPYSRTYFANKKKSASIPFGNSAKRASSRSVSSSIGAGNFRSASSVASGKGENSLLPEAYNPSQQTQAKLGNFQTSSKNEQIKEQLRKLQREKTQANENPFQISQEDLVSGIAGKKTDKKEKKSSKKPLRYNYKEIANKIRQAKTPQSASRAVIAAKRKVSELKRKLANSDADTEAIRIALNHAKSIERVAKKKKRHLELEEIVARTRAKDEQQNPKDKAANSLDSAMNEYAQGKIQEWLKGVDEAETQKYCEAVQEYKESGQEISDAMVEALSAASEAMTKELREMLEEAQELLESMETLDPHMSKEDFEKVKKKHRNDEEKDIVKADADYWKAMIRHLVKNGDAAFRSGSGQAASFSPSAVPGISLSFNAPPPAEVAMASFDEQA